GAHLMGFADRRYGARRPGGRGGWNDGPRGYGGPAGGGGLFGYTLTPWVKRLLAANFAVFVAISVVGLLPFEWAVDVLGFSTPDLFRHPWSPVTYMFVHANQFGHIFFNMIILFFFGPPLERAWGGREFLKFYLVCGVGAALTSVLLYQWIGPVSVIGASGALMGVMLAFAMKWPDARVLLWFIIPVKVKYLVGVIIILDLWATRSALGGDPGGGVATWAHLGGAATAWVYLRYGDRIEARLRRMKPRRPKLGVETGSSATAGGRTTEKRHKNRPVDGDALDKVDRILDKIRDSGIEALTAEEKAYLDDMSRRYRGSD
ncbi:MAG: rhomboid family intramembrane serine protease, partial [Gemmatimonadetes bacterium]|nr:rhomboid family intramembrane serine protease [Gemmatimonadota bacterium]